MRGALGVVELMLSVGRGRGLLLSLLDEHNGILGQALRHDHICDWLIKTWRMVIMLQDMQTVQPQVMSFRYLNRKFFQNIKIFALCEISSFWLFWEAWPCGLENDILSTESNALRELLF